jgi:formylglycine-generating enzyme required for sulfatase activity
VLGNTFEWCQDNEGASKPLRTGIYNDLISLSAFVVEKAPRILRGGAFNYRPAFARSANRIWFAPAYRNTNDGFRPSRTYH